MFYSSFRIGLAKQLFIASCLVMLGVFTIFSQRNNEADVNNEDVTARMIGPMKYNDPDLLQHIRDEYLVPPSDGNYNLMRDKDTLEDYQNHERYNSYMYRDVAYPKIKDIIVKLFSRKRNGFFVEAGAMDGEFLSNTLYLEEKLGWSGLLVEVDSDQFHSLLRKNRHAWSSNTCLSIANYPHKEILYKHSDSNERQPMPQMYARAQNVLSSFRHQDIMHVDGADDKPVSEWFYGNGFLVYEPVQCLPLASLLLALNITHVHFISLDVEGAERLILESFPWDEILIDVWLVEHKSKEGELDTKFIDFFRMRGYYYLPEKISAYLDNYFFIHNSIKISL